MGHINFRDMEGDKRSNHFPGDEDHHEFSQSDKPVGKEAQAVDEGEYDDDAVGKLAVFFPAEAREHPFGSRCDIRPAQPDAQEDHQENLVKDWPEPGNPDAFESIYKQQGDEPHGARNVEHPGSVGNAQHIPGKRVAAQQVVGFAFLGLLFQDDANEYGRKQVNKDNGDIQTGQLHKQGLLYCFVGSKDTNY